MNQQSISRTAHPPFKILYNLLSYIELIVDNVLVDSSFLVWVSHFILDFVFFNIWNGISLSHPAAVDLQRKASWWKFKLIKICEWLFKHGWGWTVF